MRRKEMERKQWYQRRVRGGPAGHTNPTKNVMDQPDTQTLFPKSVEASNKSWSRKIQDFTQHENFVRFFRFGALDQNILLLGLLTGVGIDSIIHKRFGVAVSLITVSWYT
eukprot:TRINITY_DN4262_c0_g1_i6.p1 TRINITY_DN4262_c0_g1~~TRINITY_DN4262_c0_g1_i6.p1  ORF type:complete len:110 (+),score=10.67 TRINITY_DN4262_c0_g1_i6:1-330(+)